ncbi:hypothetical protein ACFOQM_04220 [Paenibacillus sp. GCM10012307]|uniref:50S ribosomal protein L33 n=1 Tax=Paenibacillus roseus TaxID=2798579 RepID=A0A934MPL0_9BACL|nr:50S ribosomal protein L33 [Paenibacillus roseus]MBJ6360519.1 50S ribosomal protein L33 [Paenibacillus roseus]
MPKVSRQDVQKLIGKHVYAMKKDGTVVSGKLVRVHSSQLYLQPRAKGKKVYTKAILPLVLFDLLAVGTAPFANGGGYSYGYGYGGYPYGGGYGFGPYGGFW